MLLIPRYPDATQQAAEARRQFRTRLASAVRRRVGYAWSRWVDAPRPPLAEGAVAWLTHTGSEGGLPAVRGEPRCSPGLTAACAAVMANYGQHEIMQQWLAWLLVTQLPSGAFPDARGSHPSPIDTAQVVRALLALGSRDAANAIVRACRYLHEWIADQGGVKTASDSGSLDAWTAPALRLACLPPLLQAAERFEEPAWEQAVQCEVATCRRTLDLTRWSSPSHLFAQQMSAMLDLGLVEEVRHAMQLPAAVQLRDGGVPAWPNAGWVSSAGLAQFATLWYRLGERDRADRAQTCLHRHQQADGGFLGSWGCGACFHPTKQTTWTALHVLEASQLQVQASFAAQEMSLEETIDPWDGRVQAVRRALDGLPLGARVADVGCGKGRFLRHLAEWYPQYRWTGIDASPALLRHLPDCVDSQPGNLHNLPFADASFDTAFAVESLEHALLPEQAVRELCRIVRPGGRIVIIDKQQSHQPLSKHEPWERWFTPDEVRHWLAAACDQVQVVPIPHGQHTQPTGLFLCWTAKCRAAASERHAA